MNLDFKILWFDDQLPSARRRWIEEYLKEQYELKLIVQQQKGNEDISDFNFEEFDLILMDYGLIGNENGVQKYKEIRGKYAVTDVAFYSTTMQECRERLRILEDEGVDIEGVYYLDITSDTLFEEKIEKIIDKIVKRSESISNLRGLILSETAKYDRRIFDLASQLVIKYGLRKELEEYLSNDIHSDLLTTFTRNENLYAGSKCKVGYYMNAQTSMPRLDANHQVRVLNRILKILRAKGIKVDSRLDNFYQKYLEDIIYYRNAFAHKEEAGNTIKIKDKVFEINEEFHKEIRKKLVFYSEVIDVIEKL